MKRIIALLGFGALAVAGVVLVIAEPFGQPQAGSAPVSVRLVSQPDGEGQSKSDVWERDHNFVSPAL
jgi:hypothetical protein